MADKKLNVFLEEEISRKLEEARKRPTSLKKSWLEESQEECDIILKNLWKMENNTEESKSSVFDFEEVYHHSDY